MDFRKAFDSVSHDGLLLKLKSAGIAGKLGGHQKAHHSILMWKFQYEHIENGTLNMSGAKTQDSVSGPLLFAVFINDLPQSVHFATPYVFANYTKCLQSITPPNDVAKLQEDINSMSSWSHTFNLLFNESKFVHLRFWQKSANTPIYTINSKSINTTSQHKDLGVNFSNNLHWAKHYEIIIAKAYQTLGLIRCTFVLNSLDVRKQLYISLVRSQLLYVLFSTLETSTFKGHICFRTSPAKSH